MMMMMMMSLDNRLKALFGAAVGDYMEQSHEIHNKIRAQIKRGAIREEENI